LLCLVQEITNMAIRKYSFEIYSDKGRYAKDADR